MNLGRLAISVAEVGRQAVKFSLIIYFNNNSEQLKIIGTQFHFAPG